MAHLEPQNDLVCCTDCKPSAVWGQAGHPRKRFANTELPLVQYFGERIRPWGEHEFSEDTPECPGAQSFSVSAEFCLCCCCCKKRALLGNKIVLFSERSWSVLCQGSDDVFLDQTRGTPAFFTLFLLWDFSHCLCQAGWAWEHSCSVSSCPRACLLGLFGILWLEKSHSKVNEVPFSFFTFPQVGYKAFVLFLMVCQGRNALAVMLILGSICQLPQSPNRGQYLGSFYCWMGCSALG